MATRFYFPVSTASDLTPSFDAGWEDTSEALRRQLARTKGSSAITLGSQIGPWTANNTTQALDRQYVSEPLAAQTISGTVSGQLMVREYATGDNADQSWLGIFVCNSSGSKVATLLTLAARGPVLEFISNATHRNKTLAAAIALTSYSCAAGDRIVVEIGYGCSGATASPEASAKWGENATDLPANETQTTDGAGWVELSGTIAYLHTGSAAGGATFGGAGVESKTYAESAAGSVAFAGAGVESKTYSNSGAGTVTLAGAGVDALVSGTTYNESGTGGAVFAGAGTHSVAFAEAPTGGAALAGSASHSQSHVASSSGGLAFGGSAVHAQVFAELAAGTLILGGAGLGTQAHGQTGSGVVTLAGAGIGGLVYAETAIGGAAFAGAGVDTVGHSHDEVASGGALFTGAGPTSTVHQGTAAGGLLFGGAGANVLIAYSTATGGVIFGGSGIDSGGEPAEPAGWRAVWTTRPARRGGSHSRARRRD